MSVKLATSIALIAGMSTATAATECNIDFNGNLKLEHNVMTITTAEKDKIVIYPSYQVYINGEEVYLDSEQTQWVTDYYQGINQAAPEVAGIAAEGIALATDAIELALGELLGGDAYVIEDMSEQLAELNHSIQSGFYAEDGSIRLNTDNFDDGDFIDAAWEKEFEQTIEKVMVSSMGHLMIALGTELLMSGGDTDAFEQRMENFAQNIEADVEAKAVHLEARAEALCLRMHEVDAAETQLQLSMPEFRGLDIIKMDQQASAM